MRTTASRRTCGPWGSRSSSSCSGTCPSRHGATGGPAGGHGDRRCCGCSRASGLHVGGSLRRCRVQPRRAWPLCQPCNTLRSPLLLRACAGRDPGASVRGDTDGGGAVPLRCAHQVMRDCCTAYKGQDLCHVQGCFPWGNPGQRLAACSPLSCRRRSVLLWLPPRSDDLRSVLDGLLSKDPGKRPTSAQVGPAAWWGTTARVRTFLPCSLWAQLAQFLFWARSPLLQPGRA